MTRPRHPRRGAHRPQRSLLTPDQLALGRRLCRVAKEIDSAFDAEWFVSDLLGQFWERRNEPRAHDLPEDGEVALATLVQILTVLGGRGARILLEVIRRLDRRELGVLAGMRAETLRAAPLPAWLDGVGTARVTGARSASLRGEGEGLLLSVESEHVQPHTIGVYIDERSAGIAKHLHLMHPIDDDRPDNPWNDLGDDLTLRPVDPVLACARVRAAMDQTDATIHAPVGRVYAELRVLVLARVMPAGIPVAADLSRAAGSPPA